MEEEILECTIFQKNENKLFILLEHTSNLKNHVNTIVFKTIR